MEPSEFLSRDQFERLTGEDMLEYVERFVAASSERRKIGKSDERALAYAEHCLDLAEWMLHPEEYERRVRAPLWDVIWTDAEKFMEVYDAGLASPDVSDAEKERLRERKEVLLGLIQHRRDIEDLPTSRAEEE